RARRETKVPIQQELMAGTPHEVVDLIGQPENDATTTIVAPSAIASRRGSEQSCRLPWGGAGLPSRGSVVFWLSAAQRCRPPRRDRPPAAAGRGVGAAATGSSLVTSWTKAPRVIANWS